MRLALVLAAIIIAGADPMVVAGPRHIEGGVTMFQKGQSQMVVCSMESPYLCKLVRTVPATRVVLATTGKETLLARGGYVTVDAAGQAGPPVAVTITVFPNRMVRSIQGFKSSQGPHVQMVLKHLPGIRTAKVLGELGEVYIVFDDHATTPDALERAAARKGVRLTLPGQ